MQVKWMVFKHGEILRALGKLKPLFEASPEGLTLADVIRHAKTPEEEALFRTAFTMAEEHQKRFVAGFREVIYERLDEHRHQIEIRQNSRTWPSVRRHN